MSWKSLFIFNTNCYLYCTYIRLYIKRRRGNEKCFALKLPLSSSNCNIFPIKHRKEVITTVGGDEGWVEKGWTWESEGVAVGRRGPFSLFVSHSFWAEGGCETRWEGRGGWKLQGGWGEKWECEGGGLRRLCVWQPERMARNNKTECQTRTTHSN